MEKLGEKYSIKKKSIRNSTGANAMFKLSDRTCIPEKSRHMNRKTPNFIGSCGLEKGDCTPEA